MATGADDPTPTRIRRHLRVRGKVQGVAFRAHTRDEAIAVGVAGWVRNLPDGRVEAVFEGPEAAVAQVVRWCHEGPSWARVDGVDVTEEAPEGTVGFEIR